MRVVQVAIALSLLVQLAAGRVPASQQRLQMLSHYDGTVPRPAPLVNTRTYTPVISTVDHARTWTPNYPTPYYYDRVDVAFAPACQWPKMPSGLYKVLQRCKEYQMHDVSVQLKIVYAVVAPDQTSRRSAEPGEEIVAGKQDGVKSIGDAPEEDSPPPFVLSVKDGDGNDLTWALYRSEKEWFVHYRFVKPVVERAFYTVEVNFQLQQVMQGTKDWNEFKAPWLSEWNAPVHEMYVTWAFPKDFEVTEYAVEPSDTQEDDAEIRGLTSVCCGAEAKAEDEMERCTTDAELGHAWARLEGPCEGGLVILSTHFELPEEEESMASAEDGVEGAGVYKIRFEPGIIEDEDPAGVNKDKVQWWVWVLVILLIVPCCAACIWTAAKYGPEEHFYPGWLDDCYIIKGTPENFKKKKQNDSLDDSDEIGHAGSWPEKKE